MFPQRASCGASARPAPRARGDVPAIGQEKGEHSGCSPCTRGCSPVRQQPAQEMPLLPVHAGMFPSRRRRGRGSCSAPRARGDVPWPRSGRRGTRPCSPCTRGCSPHQPQRALAFWLLPVHAGMFPPRRRTRRSPASAPRARGDVPGEWRTPLVSPYCSPCTRGCSPKKKRGEPHASLLPVHAGMFPAAGGTGSAATTAPRARGDVPGADDPRDAGKACSPCTRGCSPRLRGDVGDDQLLPVHAGMFPAEQPYEGAQDSAPRARGDVPPFKAAGAGAMDCSPCTRGCSLDGPEVFGLFPLLPVHAGMFPCCPRRRPWRGSAPRARGDVPQNRAISSSSTPCSPCTRGCSHGAAHPCSSHQLLPVPAGMFPGGNDGVVAHRAAPRARGDVPAVAGGGMGAALCSPCTRGCSPRSHAKSSRACLLPVHAGMFPPHRWRALDH